MTITPIRPTVIAYIDGFNLYYGLLRDSPDLKWLDLYKMIRMLCPHYEVSQVKYFTAEVPAEGNRKERQAVYWKALEQTGVKIIKGRLEERQKECMAKQCTHVGFRKYFVPVEKRTDVNLALHIVTDARLTKPDAICIISGDTDLIPAMEMVAKNYPCKRLAYIPCTEKKLKYRRVDEFELHYWTTSRLIESVVSDARFKDILLPGEADKEIKCPASWLKKV